MKITFAPHGEKYKCNQTGVVLTKRQLYGYRKTLRNSGRLAAQNNISYRKPIARDKVKQPSYYRKRHM